MYLQGYMHYLFLLFSLYYILKNTLYLILIRKWMIICLKVYYLHIKQKKWSFIKRQTSTSSDNEWQRMTTSDNEWYNEWQRMTTSDSEWQQKTKSGTTSGKEWQRVPNGVNKWQWVTTSETNGKANENGTVHF